MKKMILKDLDGNEITDKEVVFEKSLSSSYDLHSSFTIKPNEFKEIRVLKKHFGKYLFDTPENGMTYLGKLIDKQLEVDKWYVRFKYSNNEPFEKIQPFCITKIDGFKVYGYGVCSNKWCDNIFVMNKKEQQDCYRLATYKEVEQALISEAKRRGFKEGVKVKFPWNATKYIMNSCDIKMKQELYNGGDKYALRGGGCCFYSNGKWAEIISQVNEYRWIFTEQLKGFGKVKYSVTTDYYTKAEAKDKGYLQKIKGSERKRE